jgi:hypothetical protein
VNAARIILGDMPVFRAGLIVELWQTTVETASPSEIGPRCGHLLRAWNSLAVERMETEGRLEQEDLATHPDRLDWGCFQAAHRRLERRSILSQFTLWPFWPNGVAVKS